MFQVLFMVIKDKEIITSAKHYILRWCQEVFDVCFYFTSVGERSNILFTCSSVALLLISVYRNIFL